MMGLITNPYVCIAVGVVVVVVMTVLMVHEYRNAAVMGRDGKLHLPNRKTK